MSKGEGLKIGIKFTQDIVGDISGNENAFTVTGKEYQYVNSVLIPGNYIVNTVERHPTAIAWQADFNLGVLTDVENYGVLKLAGGIEESFEEETYQPEVAVTGTWLRTLTTAMDGRYALESNNKGNSSESSAYLTFQAIGDEQFTIDYRVSSENNYDKFYLYHNGVAKINGISGNGNWLTYTGTAIAGENILRARYTKDKSGSSNLNAGFIDNFVLHGYYKNSGTYVSEAIPLSGENRLRWVETVPEGTSILVEVATWGAQGDWTPVENGEIITADTNLWVRATLETLDVHTTPILRNMVIESELHQQLDDILITMHPQGRFNNVEGSLIVSYDSSKGNLVGRGGAVESFIEIFTPTGLIPEPTPGIEESVTVAPAVLTAELIPMEYIDTFAEETDLVIVAPAELTVELIHIDVINP